MNRTSAVALLGIDCSTSPRKTGLALGELRGGIVYIQRCATGTRNRPPAVIATDWLRDRADALIALDAPLGWPQALGRSLVTHRAGLRLGADADRLFRRATDDEIWNRLKKNPLEVGANLIARTAVATLNLLDQIRKDAGRAIPLAWTPDEAERWRAIEVYPAATRIAHGACKRGGSLEGLAQLLDWSEVPELTQSEHAVDATVCALAAADFLRGTAVGPRDHETARIEGWIWAPSAPDCRHRQAD